MLVLVPRRNYDLAHAEDTTPPLPRVRIRRLLDTLDSGASGLRHTCIRVPQMHVHRNDD